MLVDITVFTYRYCTHFNVCSILHSSPKQVWMGFSEFYDEKVFDISTAVLYICLTPNCLMNAFRQNLFLIYSICIIELNLTVIWKV